MMSCDSKRICWLDVSRGIAFLMVIYSHLEFVNDSVMRYFLPVYLTMFFFVSGYLFKENCSFSKIFEQRTRTLLLPFLVLGAVMILMSQLVTFNAKLPLAEEIKGLLFQNGKNDILWFVAALYVYSIIFYWIERIAGNIRNLLFISIALFISNWIYIQVLQLPHIPWHLHNFGYACCWMCLGKCYKTYEQQVDQYVGTSKAFLCALIVYVALISIFDLHISFAGSKYIVDAWIATVCGLIVMIYVSKHILQHSRLLLFVGANTLFYFAFHGKVYSLLTTISHKFISEEMLSMGSVPDMLAVGIVFADAITLILPAMFVNRFCPCILGSRFKLW